jgi:hypothetical protein
MRLEVEIKAPNMMLRFYIVNDSALKWYYAKRRGACLMVVTVSLISQTHSLVERVTVHSLIIVLRCSARVYVYISLRFWRFEVCSVGLFMLSKICYTL